MFRGVITGCSAKEEAFLPRWWEHFSKYNTCPVTFVDFGMSDEALSFCKAHGHLMQSLSKHSALRATPYQETIWTDIHCEIQENLSPLFEMSRCEAGFAIVKRDTYQTEVFSFLKTQVRKEKVRHHFSFNKVQLGCRPRKKSPSNHTH